MIKTNKKIVYNIHIYCFMPTERDENKNSLVLRRVKIGLFSTDTISTTKTEMPSQIQQLLPISERIPLNFTYENNLYKQKHKRLT